MAFPTLIAQMFIEEVSGVDAPANTTPGWPLTKFAEPKDHTAVENAKR